VPYFATYVTFRSSAAAATAPRGQQRPGVVKGVRKMPAQLSSR